MAKELSPEAIAKFRALTKSTNETARNLAIKKLKDAGVSVEEKADKVKKTKKEPAKAVKKSAPAKPAVVAKKTAAKKVFIVDGKELDETDVNFCEKVLAAWKKRRKLAKTAASTYRTKSVMRIIAEKVVDSMEKAIDSISSAEIKKNPQAFALKIHKQEQLGKDFLNGFKDLLGKDFDKSEIKKELDGFEKMIGELFVKLKLKAK